MPERVEAGGVYIGQICRPIFSSLKRQLYSFCQSNRSSIEMAELSFSGRGFDASLLYWNPNIFFQADPDDPTPVIPTRDIPVYILASIKNSGKQTTNGATVKFWVCDPSTSPTPDNSQLVGVSNVSLTPGETKEVLCVTPWVPQWINAGHQCIICEVSALNDPAPVHPNTPWDILNRHVAQHNVDIRFSSPRNYAILSQMAALSLHQNTSVKVTIRKAPKEIFKQALASFGVSGKINVTDAARSGLVEDYVPGQCPPKECDSTLEWKSPKPNRTRPFHALVELPDDNFKRSAAIFLVEQHDEKGKLIGGVAVVLIGGEQQEIPRIQAVAPAIPVAIPYRPYATDPRTGMMIPDGIFVSVLGEQYINVETRNDGKANLDGLSIYVEGVADPAISTAIRLASPIGGVALGGASFKSIFAADFTRATPGATRVSFIVQQQSGGVTKSTRILKKIFIMGLSFDKVTKTFEIKVPQGSLFYHAKTVIAPPRPGIGGTGGCGGCKGPKKCCCSGGESTGVEGVKPIPIFVKRGTLLWVPSPPYPGTHGPLPFEDPLNKIPLAIVAAILSLIALIAWLIKLFGGDDDSGGGGGGGGGGGDGVTVGVVVGGTFDETSGDATCCTLEGVITDSSFLGAITTAAVAMWVTTALSDGKDPHELGRDNTKPEKGELTTGEFVEFDITPTTNATIGVPWKGKLEWSYERSLSSGRTLRYGTTTDFHNTHHLRSYRVSIDSTVSPNKHYTHNHRLPLIIGAQFVKPDGNLFRGSELYVYAWLVSNRGQHLGVELRDDGYGYLAGFDETGTALDNEDGKKLLEKVMVKKIALRTQASKFARGWESGILPVAANGVPAAENEDTPTPRPNIGSYVGGFSGSRELTFTDAIRAMPQGPTTWYVFVLAQDINTVPEGTDPREAAKTVGGMLLTTSFELGWNGDPCQMDYDAVVEVF
ncbi:hypothetical protein ABW19_dt0206105 [Dactylella cylindrospora]|nr:hypothetical protein ABW19_dt0206105 [Dactylella cylindrospora]